MKVFGTLKCDESIGPGSKIKLLNAPGKSPKETWFQDGPKHDFLHFSAPYSESKIMKRSSCMVLSFE